MKNCKTTILVECRLKNNIKPFSEKLKEVLPDLISSQQTAYLKSRHVGERERLISDIIEITEIK